TLNTCMSTFCPTAPATVIEFVSKVSTGIGRLAITRSASQLRVPARARHRPLRSRLRPGLPRPIHLTVLTISPLCHCMKRSRQGTTPAREVLTGCAKLRSLASGPAWQTLSHRAEPCRRCKCLLQGIVGHVERLHDVIRDPPATDAPRLSLCDDW